MKGGVSLPIFGAKQTKNWVSFSKSIYQSITNHTARNSTKINQACCQDEWNARKHVQSGVTLTDMPTPPGDPKKGGDKKKSATPPKRKSVNQMNKQIEQKIAPRTVQRVDVGKVKGEQTHIHFKDGNALNIDGTWKHGAGRALSRAEKMVTKQWLVNTIMTLEKNKQVELKRWLNGVVSTVGDAGFATAHCDEIFATPHSGRISEFEFAQKICVTIGKFLHDLGVHESIQGAVFVNRGFLSESDLLHRDGFVNYVDVPLTLYLISREKNQSYDHRETYSYPMEKLQFPDESFMVAKRFFAFRDWNSGEEEFYCSIVFETYLNDQKS